MTDRDNLRLKSSGLNERKLWTDARTCFAVMIQTVDFL